MNVMQVPQVTEEAALAVIGLYPTLFSLAKAYSMLVSSLLLLTFTMFIRRTILMFFPFITPVYTCKPEQRSAFHISCCSSTIYLTQYALFFS